MSPAVRDLVDEPSCGPPTRCTLLFAWLPLADALSAGFTLAIIVRSTVSRILYVAPRYIGRSTNIVGPQGDSTPRTTAVIVGAGGSTLVAQSVIGATCSAEIFAPARLLRWLGRSRPRSYAMGAWAVQVTVCCAIFAQNEGDVSNG